MHTYFTILRPACSPSPNPIRNHLVCPRSLVFVVYPCLAIVSTHLYTILLTHSYLCLCFGFLLQMIYTYRPFFLLTLLHPSHSFLTELLTFMPRDCCAFCNRRPLKHAVRSSSGCARAWRRLGRSRVLQAHVGVWMWRCRRKVREGEKNIRRRGSRRDRGSILAGLSGRTMVIWVLMVVMVVEFEEISAKKSTCPPRSFLYVVGLFEEHMRPSQGAFATSNK